MKEQGREWCYQNHGRAVGMGEGHHKSSCLKPRSVVTLGTIGPAWWEQSKSVPWTISPLPLVFCWFLSKCKKVQDRELKEASLQRLYEAGRGKKKKRVEKGYGGFTWLLHLVKRMLQILLTTMLQYPLWPPIERNFL